MLCFTDKTIFKVDKNACYTFGQNCTKYSKSGIQFLVEPVSEFKAREINEIMQILEKNCSVKIVESDFHGFSKINLVTFLWQKGYLLIYKPYIKAHPSY